MQHTVTLEMWNKEYGEHQIIPSSTREDPSKVLVLASKLMPFGGGNGTRILDAGCGNGRNAIWLAKRFNVKRVYALDSSRRALEEVTRKTREAHVEERVEILESSLAHPLPFTDGYLDIVIDSYVSFDLPTKIQRRYWEQLRRILADGGFYFGSLFHTSDAYYGSFIRRKGRNPTVTDPHNGLKMRLWEEDDVKKFVHEQGFLIRYFFKLEFEDIVQGTPFKRSIIAFLAKKLLVS